MRIRRKKHLPGAPWRAQPLRGPLATGILGPVPHPCPLSHEGGCGRGVGGVAVLSRASSVLVSPGRKDRISWLPGSTWWRLAGPLQDDEAGVLPAPGHAAGGTPRAASTDSGVRPATPPPGLVSAPVSGLLAPGCRAHVKSGPLVSARAYLWEPAVHPGVSTPARPLLFLIEFPPRSQGRLGGEL